MNLTLLYKIISLSIFKNAVAYKKGALILLSLPLTVGYLKSIKMLFKHVDPFDLVLPIIALVCCLTLYFLFFCVDFAWGLIAAKHESKGNADWVQSNKLYSSLGKIGGVILIDVLMLFVIVFLVVVGFVKMSVAFLVISVLLNVLAILYELHSIGENIKRKTGTKPAYLMFFDRITTIIENKIINKIENQV